LKIKSPKPDRIKIIAIDFSSITGENFYESGCTPELAR
jgi:hypothetical protein